MPRLPLLKNLKVKRQSTDTFLGYNRSMKIRDGEFYHMENLSSACYPLMASRQKRALVAKLQNAQALCAKGRLIWADGGRLYMEGQEVAGIELSEGEKSLVSMGAYILIFPDKLYLNCENPADFGKIDAEFQSESQVSVKLCKADGSEMADIPVADTPPENPMNGQLWIDSSGSAHSLKQYSSVSDMWVEQTAYYCRISSEGLGRDFAANDGVEISGLTGDASHINGSHIVEKSGEDYILIRALITKSCTQSEKVEICRKMPDLDFVTEAENRLWGCKYGMVDGKALNEIYACALGDFKNWNRFQGLADDSYRASVGTDGPFTAAATHLGYPIFFKENCLHKVYISATGAHRIADTACYGVELGSHKSVANMGDRLYYKAPDSICVYEGSLPRSISQNLGDVKYSAAVGGAMGEKYFVSMEDEKAQRHLFVFDSRRGLWHREDGLNVKSFAELGSELFALCADGRLLAMGGSRGELEGDFYWQADSGLMGYSESGQKYVGRLILRMKLPAGSEAELFIEYDSEGCFQHLGHVSGSGTGSFSIPIRPRRCDHFRLRLTGYGEIRLYSIVKQIEIGGDY